MSAPENHAAFEVPGEPAITPLLERALAPEPLPADLAARIRRELDARMRPARSNIIWRISWSTTAAAAAVALYFFGPPRPTETPHPALVVAQASAFDWDGSLEFDAALYGAAAQVDAAIADAERLQVEVKSGTAQRSWDQPERPDTR